MSKNVPRRDLAKAISVEQDVVRYHPEQIALAVHGTGIDHLGALAVSNIFRRYFQGLQVRPVLHPK